MSDKGGVYQEFFQRYGPFKRRNHLTVKLYQRQGLFNGSDLWCGSFNGKNLSTVKYFNSKDINGINLQRHGFLHGRDPGFVSFNGGDLSSPASVVTDNRDSEDAHTFDSIVSRGLLAMCYLAPMTSSKPCGTMQLFLQWFLSTNISKGSLAARIWRWSCLLNLFFSCTGRQRLLSQSSKLGITRYFRSMISKSPLTKLVRYCN